MTRRSRSIRANARAQGREPWLPRVCTEGGWEIDLSADDGDAMAAEPYRPALRSSDHAIQIP